MGWCNINFGLGGVLVWGVFSGWVEVLVWLVVFMQFRLLVCVAVWFVVAADLLWKSGLGLVGCWVFMLLGFKFWLGIGDVCCFCISLFGV